MAAALLHPGWFVLPAILVIVRAARSSRRRLLILFATRDLMDPVFDVPILGPLSTDVGYKEEPVSG
jgi:hypothetical protein